MVILSSHVTLYLLGTTGFPDMYILVCLYQNRPLALAKMVNDVSRSTSIHQRLPVASRILQKGNTILNFTTCHAIVAGSRFSPPSLSELSVSRRRGATINHTSESHAHSITVADPGFQQKKKGGGALVGNFQNNFFWPGFT